MLSKLRYHRVCRTEVDQQVFRINPIIRKAKHRRNKKKYWQLFKILSVCKTLSNEPCISNDNSTMNLSSLTWKFHGSTGIQIIEIHSLCRDLRRWNIAIIQNIVCNPAGNKRMEFRRRSRQKSRSSHFWHRFSYPSSNLDSRIGKHKSQQ